MKGDSKIVEIRGAIRGAVERNSTPPINPVGTVGLLIANKCHEESLVENDKQIELSDWRTVPDIVSRHPNVFPTIASLRFQLRNRDANGLAFACRRVGKRLLLSETRVAQWLASGQAGKAAV
jgi:hypothetical protein